MLDTLYQEEGSGVVYSRPSYMHGGGWHSFERGINPGDVRVINSILSRAWLVTSRGWFRKPEVHWVSVKPEELREVDINEKP